MQIRDEVAAIKREGRWTLSTGATKTPQPGADKARDRGPRSTPCLPACEATRPHRDRPSGPRLDSSLLHGDLGTEPDHRYTGRASRHDEGSGSGHGVTRARADLRPGIQWPPAATTASSSRPTSPASSSFASCTTGWTTAATWALPDVPDDEASVPSGSLADRFSHHSGL